MKKIILRIFLVVLIIGMIGFYLYDLLINHTDPTKNLFRTLSVVCVCIAGLIRTFQLRRRQPLEFFSEQFGEILKDAFISQPFWRKKLLCAIRLFSEENYRKAIKYLQDLRQRAETKQDLYAVDLFAALSFHKLGFHDQSSKIYRHMISTCNADSRIFSNLGHVLSEMGEHEKALENYGYALSYDRNNAVAYNNMAQEYFALHEFEKAISYANQSLEINPKFHNASTLLAVIYSLTGDKENAEKYSHIAITSGRDPESLKQTIAYYKSAQQID